MRKVCGMSGPGMVGREVMEFYEWWNYTTVVNSNLATLSLSN